MPLHEGDALEDDGSINGPSLTPVADTTRHHHCLVCALRELGVLSPADANISNPLTGELLQV